MCTGFEQAVDSCKSLLLTCALFEGQVSPQQASDLARLETRHQVRELWVHESSVGLSSTTNPKPRGNPPTACSGKPMSIKQKACTCTSAFTLILHD